VQITLRHPTRTTEISGPRTVDSLLKKLELNRESVIVIRSGTIVPGDAPLQDSDEIEIRPVISGGFA
jgi:sulfur carrier protein